MKKMTKIYSGKTNKELEKEAVSIRQEISKLQLSFKSNPAKDTNGLAKKRKQLTVLLTVLSEKKEV